MHRKLAARLTRRRAAVPVSLAGLVNDNGIGTAPGDANIDGSGYGFPAGEFPTGTRWSRGATDGDLPFTVKQNKAFYITSLTKPGDEIVVHQPVPIHDGDQVNLLGYDRAPLHWTKQDGNLVVHVPPAATDTGEYAWTFKITW